LDRVGSRPNTASPDAVPWQGLARWRVWASSLAGHIHSPDRHSFRAAKPPRRGWGACCSPWGAYSRWTLSQSYSNVGEPSVRFLGFSHIPAIGRLPSLQPIAAIRQSGMQHERTGQEGGWRGSWRGEKPAASCSVHDATGSSPGLGTGKAQGPACAAKIVAHSDKARRGQTRLTI
jgi:hypothetical protein